MNNNALHLLEDLGGSSDEIASTLKSKGISGQPGNLYACPLTKYLLSMKVNGYVSLTSVHWSYRARFTRKYEDAALPVAARMFVRKFDDGEYPELVSHYV